MTDTRDSLTKTYDMFIHENETRRALYDWYGHNRSIFAYVHQFSGDRYYQCINLLNHLGNRHMFPLYMLMIMGGVLLTLGYKKLKGTVGSRYFIAMWASIFLVLFAGYFINGGVIKLTKIYFEFPRPYIALQDVQGMDIKTDAYDAGDDSYRSFPSGHAAFITMMVIGLWPALGAFTRLIGIGLIIGVCWARMALGMHFPADLLAGVVITLIVMMFVRIIVNWSLRRFFKISC